MAELKRLESDPLRSFKFRVTFGNASTYGLGGMGFMSVSGLGNINIDVIPYREGGYNTTPHKLPGQADFPPVTFSRGLCVGDNGFMKWMTDLFDYVNGEGTTVGDSTNDFRGTIQVDVLSHPVKGGVGVPMASFILYNAWPSAISFTDLDAGAQSVVVQSMTIVHEGFRFQVADNLNNTGVRISGAIAA